MIKHPSGGSNGPWLIGLAALCLICLGGAEQDKVADADGDSMPDDFELFFGLNPTNFTDAMPDYDGDRWSNLRESMQLTDPFAPDTDRDGFDDDEDVNPISRAYIQWGAPQFTTEDQYDYAHPEWFLAAYKNGGEWIDLSLISNVPFQISSCSSAWYVAAKESNDVGSLSMDLDRTILTNNLVFALHYLSNSNASLYVDVLDTNGAVIGGGDLFGNIMTGSNRESFILLALPLAAASNAAVVHLRRGTGEIMIFESQLYIDEDGDGLDADQERQLETSDYCADTDKDGINDYDEVFVYGTDPCKKDKDQDEGGDQGRGKNKKNGIIYVDQVMGDDRHNGRARDVAGQDGPKKTLHKGMDAVDEDGAHTLIIKPGVYNENLDISGKNVQVIIEGNVRL